MGPLVLQGYGVEGRAERSSNSLENPSVSLVDPRAWAQIFGEFRSAAGVPVDADVAMSVPAIWCAVTFLSGAIASLPLKVHRKSVNGRDTLDSSPMAKMLGGKVNDEWLNTFNWRRDQMVSTLLLGRGLAYIERWNKGTGDARYLWPFEKSKTTVKRVKGRLIYDYRAGGQVESYTADQVIDIKMLGGVDGVSVFDPVGMMKDTIGLAVALRRYSSRFFLQGGVPPMAMEGPAASPVAVARAKNDTNEAVKSATRDESNFIYVPPGHKLTPIGFNPEKSQLLESQAFMVEEVSRMYNLPPSFLHSLLNMPFATVEQQDLNLIKHNLVHWCEQWEQELNVKLFGNARGRYIEFDLNGLMRGDFLSRMQAYASAVQGAVMKPNEARRRENLPDAEGGDVLYINGAILPIGEPNPATDGTGAVKPDPGDDNDEPDLNEPAAPAAPDPDQPKDNTQ